MCSALHLKTNTIFEVVGRGQGAGGQQIFYLKPPEDLVNEELYMVI